MTDTTVVPEKRVLDSVVTSENLQEFQLHKLEVQDTAKPVEAPIEVVAEPEVAEPQVVEKDDKDEAKGKISERMRELADKAKKAEEKSSLTAKELEEIRKERDELKAKLTPPKIEENPKPDRSQFTDAFEYAEALADWKVKEEFKRRDQEAYDARVKADEERTVTTWKERIDSTRKEVPDFDAKLKNSDVTISDEVRRAIMDSEVGPKMLLYFVENPSYADKINKMTVGKAYLELGKLESKLTLPPSPEVVVPKVEVSKAPPPITPLRGGGAPADLPINGKGEWTGTHEQYKEARLAGKIK